MHSNALWLLKTRNWGDKSHELAWSFHRSATSFSIANAGGLLLW